MKNRIRDIMCGLVMAVVFLSGCAVDHVVLVPPPAVADDLYERSPVRAVPESGMHLVKKGACPGLSRPFLDRHPVKKPSGKMRMAGWTTPEWSNISRFETAKNIAVYVQFGDRYNRQNPYECHLIYGSVSFSEHHPLNDLAKKYRMLCLGVPGGESTFTVYQNSKWLPMAGRTIRQTEC